MKKKVQDVYGEILRLRNEFYQKWQETSQYDDNRGAYKAKYEAFDKALELLTPSFVDPQPKDSGKLTHSVTKISDQEPEEYKGILGEQLKYIDNEIQRLEKLKEESVSEDLLDEIHDRWEDYPHIKWPKCPYKDFKNIACHFANWQKQQMMKDAVIMEAHEEYGELWGNIRKCNTEKGKKYKVIIIKEE